MRRILSIQSTINLRVLHAHWIKELVQFGGIIDLNTAPIKNMPRIREKLSKYAADCAQWPLPAANILGPVRTSFVCNGASGSWMVHKAWGRGRAARVQIQE